MASVLDLVKHYQHTIEKYPNDEQRILKCIDKLFNLDVTVQHLQDTGVGRTVNALRKEPGDVGPAARSLVYKWKAMVAAEESDQDADRNNDISTYNGYDSRKDPDDSSSQSRSKHENYEKYSSSKSNHKEQSTEVNGGHSWSKRKYHSSEEEEPDIKKSKHYSSSDDDYRRSDVKIKKEKSESESDDQDSSDSHSDESDSELSESSQEEPKVKEIKKEKSREKDNSREGKTNTSKHSSHSSSSKESKPSSHYDSSHKHSKHSSASKDRSSSEKSSHKEKSNSHKHKSSSRETEKEVHEKKYKSQKSSDSEKDKKYSKANSNKDSGSDNHKTNHKSDSSEKNKRNTEKHSSSTEKHSSNSEKHSKSSEKHSSSSAKHLNSSEKYSGSSGKHSTSSEKHSSSSERHTKPEKHKSSSHNSSDKEKQRSSIEKDEMSSKHKSKENGSSSKDREKHGSSSKEKLKEGSVSKSSGHSEKKQSSSDSKSSSSDKSKHDKCDDKSKSTKSKHKSSSSSEHKSSKSSSSKVKEDVPKKKVQVNSNTEDSDDGIDCGSGASFAEALGMISPVKSKKKLKDINSPSSNFNNDLSAAALLAPNAKLAPLPQLDMISALPEISPNYKPRPPPKLLPHFSDEDAMNQVISSKNQRTKVYSGNKVIGKVTTLYEMCVQILQEHIDALEYTGGVPYEILKPVVDKATPQQLFVLEHYNPYLMEDTDHLWQKHCEKNFRNKHRQEMETWREMYMRCQEEQEHRLKSLTANIRMTQEAKKAPIKQTKMAYVDSVVKPPRNIAKKQAVHGTAFAATASPAARVAALSKSANVLKGGTRPTPTTAASSPAFVKPKKAPLMQKALQFMRGRKR